MELARFRLKNCWLVGNITPTKKGNEKLCHLKVEAFYFLGMTKKTLFRLTGWVQRKISPYRVPTLG